MQTLGYDNVLFLTANPNWLNYKGSVYVEKYKNTGYVVSDTVSRGGFFFTKRFFHVDTTKVLNGMKRK